MPPFWGAFAVGIFLTSQQFWFLGGEKKSVVLGFETLNPENNGKNNLQQSNSPATQSPSNIEWDLTNGPLSKLLELLDTKVEGSVQWVLLDISWTKGIWENLIISFNQAAGRWNGHSESSLINLNYLDLRAFWCYQTLVLKNCLGFTCFYLHGWLRFLWIWSNYNISPTWIKGVSLPYLPFGGPGRVRSL